MSYILPWECADEFKSNGFLAKDVEISPLKGLFNVGCGCGFLYEVCIFEEGVGILLAIISV